MASEFTSGIDTICAIDDAMGEESAFRTNMEADLALLDFALEDETVQQSAVPETFKMGTLSKSNLGHVAAKVAEPPPPPPVIAPVPVLAAVKKEEQEERSPGQRRKSNANGHTCPKCGMTVANFSTLIGSHKNECNPKSKEPPSIVPSAPSGAPAPPSPPPVEAPEKEDMMAKMMQQAKNIGIAKHMVPKKDEFVLETVVESPKLTPKRNGISTVAESCLTCKLEFDGDKRVGGLKCSQCDAEGHCSSCLKTITLKSLGEDRPRKFCVKCIGVLRQRLSQVKNTPPAGRGAGRGGAGRGGRREAGRGRGQPQMAVQSPNVIISGSPTLSRTSSSSPSLETQKLAQLEEQNAAQAKQIQDLKVALGSAAIQAEQTHEIETLRAELAAVKQRQEVEARERDRLRAEAERLRDQIDSGVIRSEAEREQDRKTQMAYMARLLTMPATPAEEEAVLKSQNSSRVSVEPEAGNFMIEIPLDLPPPPPAPSAIAPSSRRLTSTPLPEGVQAADMLAKSFQELRSRSSSVMDVPSVPSPPLSSSLGGLPTVLPAVGGRGRGGSKSVSGSPMAMGGRGRRMSAGGRGRGRGGIG